MGLPPQRNEGLPAPSSILAPGNAKVQDLTTSGCALEFATELTSGRQVRLNVPNVTVLLDPTLCGVIFDNVLSNAFKHGRSINPDVELTIDCAADEHEPAPLKFIASKGERVVRFLVASDSVLSGLGSRFGAVRGGGHR